MRKSIYILGILSILFIGCQDSKKTEADTSEIELIEHAEDMHVSEEDVGKNIYGNAWTDHIALNDGEPWEANAETTEGVRKMQDIISHNDASSLEDYHEMARKLNEEKNSLIKNCTMTGEAHDNLHVFLHPLIEKIDALGKATDMEDANRILEAIKENLEVYPKYFK